MTGDDTNNGDDVFEGEVLGERGADKGAIVPAPPPPKMIDDVPINWTPPRPPPAREPVQPGTPARAGKAPEILIVGGAAIPQGLLDGADMSDDRVFTGDWSTGKVRIYRRQKDWRPQDGTSKYFNLLLNEIRRLRCKCREPEFDN